MRQYRVSRALDESNYVAIDLDFDTAPEAETFLGALRGVWGRVAGSIIESPRARIVETVETREYPATR